MHIHDLIGIGFGPSNLALAIALTEQNSALDAVYLEKQSQFAWHPNMLLDGTQMQISFLKDLVTLRNPSSAFSFLNYLHQQQRLQDFINLKTFYPSRYEFNNYLTWAARQFAGQCHFGEEVTAIEPVILDDKVSHLRISSTSKAGVQQRLARNIIVSVGGSPNIPDAFAQFKNDARVFHSSTYLSSLEKVKHAKRIAIIGAGQSAAEIFVDLHGKGYQVDLITRARAMKPADDSPFINEIFNADYTDYVFNHAPQDRASLIGEFLNTNYAVADRALIEQIYALLYQQKVVGDQRHQFLRRHDIRAAQATAQGIQLQLADLDLGSELGAHYDAVVLATGYQRQAHQQLLAPLAPWLGTHEVDRNYQLISSADFAPKIFLQGSCEASHGLSDTLLSITAIRSQEISQALTSSN